MSSSGRAWMRRNKVRDQELLFTRFLRKLVEQFFKLIVGAVPGFIILLSGPSSVCSGAIFK